MNIYYPQYFTQKDGPFEVEGYKYNEGKLFVEEHIFSGSGVSKQSSQVAIYVYKNYLYKEEQKKMLSGIMYIAGMYNNCSTLVIYGLSFKNSDSGLKALKEVMRCAFENAGYTSIVYTTSNYQADIEEILTKAGFNPMGKPYRNKRTKNEITWWIAMNPDMSLEDGLVDDEDEDEYYEDGEEDF